MKNVKNQQAVDRLGHIIEQHNSNSHTLKNGKEQFQWTAMENTAPGGFFHYEIPET